MNRIRPANDHQHHHNRRASTQEVAPSVMQAPTSTRPNLGPLITTFIPPSQCSRAMLACPTCYSAWQGLSCNSQGAPQDDTACWPTATSYPAQSQAALSGLGFYSPGLICPTGYTSACSAVSTRLGEPAPTAIATPAPMSNGMFQFPLVEGETAVGCCPTGYTCAQYPGHGWQTCHQVAISTSIEVVSCESGNALSVNAVNTPTTASQKIISRMDMWAPLVQINWQATDRDTGNINAAAMTSPSIAYVGVSTAVATAIKSTLVIDPGPSPTPITASAYPTTTAAAQGNSHPLSKSATIGISVSSILLVLCVSSILIYFFWVRKRVSRYPPRPPLADRTSSTAPLARPFSKSPDLSSDASSFYGTTPKVHTLSAFSTPLAGRQDYDATCLSPVPPTRLSQSPSPSHVQTSRGSPQPNPPSPIFHTRSRQIERHLSRLNCRSASPSPSRSYSQSATPYTMSPQISPTASIFPLPPTSTLVSPQSAWYPPLPPMPPTLNTNIAPFHTLSSDYEDDSESLIDGTSPFRLKRGNTLRSLRSLAEKGKARIDSSQAGLERGASVRSVNSGRARVVEVRRDEEMAVSPLGEEGVEYEGYEDHGDGRGKDWDEERSMGRGTGG